MEQETKYPFPQASYKLPIGDSFVGGMGVGMAMPILCLESL